VILEKGIAEGGPEREFYNEGGAGDFPEKVLEKIRKT
jgi:hypothetical protein